MNAPTTAAAPEPWIPEWISVPSVVAVLVAAAALVVTIWAVARMRQASRATKNAARAKRQEWEARILANAHRDDATLVALSAINSHSRRDLMEDYHDQGISQARVSFWLSVAFSVIGFAIIALALLMVREELSPHVRIAQTQLDRELEEIGERERQVNSDQRTLNEKLEAELDRDAQVRDAIVRARLESRSIDALNRYWTERFPADPDETERPPPHARDTRDLVWELGASLRLADEAITAIEALRTHPRITERPPFFEPTELPMYDSAEREQYHQYNKAYMQLAEWARRIDSPDDPPDLSDQDLPSLPELERDVPGFEVRIRDALFAALNDRMSRLEFLPEILDPDSANRGGPEPVERLRPLDIYSKRIERLEELQNKLKLQRESARKRFNEVIAPGEGKPSLIHTSGATIVTLVSGTVVEAVGGLFFVLSTRSRKLMTEFFDRLREDQRFDDAMRLCATIKDERVSAAAKAAVVLRSSQVQLDDASLRWILGK